MEVAWWLWFRPKSLGVSNHGVALTESLCKSEVKSKKHGLELLPRYGDVMRSTARDCIAHMLASDYVAGMYHPHVKK